MSSAVGRILRGTAVAVSSTSSSSASRARRSRSWIGARPWTIALVTISLTSRIASRASAAGSAHWSSVAAVKARA